MTFKELAEQYQKVKLIPATYQAGVKISGKRSLNPALAEFKVLVAYFGRKIIRSIKPSDLEAYKLMCR